MAVYSLLNPDIYLGSIDASFYLNNIQVDVNPTLLDTTTFNSGGWTQRTPGLNDFKLTTSGFADHTNLAIEPHAYTRIGTQKLLTISETDGSDGSPAIMLNAIQGGFGLFGAVGAAGPIKLDYGASGLFARGLIMAPVLTRTTSASGTAQQLGSSVGKHIYASLHIFPVVAGTTPTLDVSILSSATGGMTGTTTVISFAQQNTGGAFFATATASSTDTWYQAKWIVGGSASPSFSFVVAVAVQ